MPSRWVICTVSGTPQHIISHQEFIQPNQILNKPSLRIVRRRRLALHVCLHSCHVVLIDPTRAPFCSPGTCR